MSQEETVCIACRGKGGYNLGEGWRDCYRCHPNRADWRRKHRVPERPWLRHSSGNNVSATGKETV